MRHDRAKSAAHAAVAKAIHDGRLPRPSVCAVCAASGCSLVYHHHSDEPQHHLDVVSLCRRCHQHVHLGIVAEPLTGELRRGDRVKRVRPRGAAVALPYSGAKWVVR